MKASLGTGGVAQDALSTSGCQVLSRVRLRSSRRMHSHRFSLTIPGTKPELDNQCIDGEANPEGDSEKLLWLKMGQSLVRSLHGDGKPDLAVDSSQNSLRNGYCPLFSSTLTVSELPMFVTARSAKPSPFRSAEATPSGTAPPHVGRDPVNHCHRLGGPSAGHARPRCSRQRRFRSRSRRSFTAGSSRGRPPRSDVPLNPFSEA